MGPFLSAEYNAIHTPTDPAGDEEGEVDTPNDDASDHQAA